MSYISRKEELKTKIIPQTKKEDFEEFWKIQLEKMRAVPLEIERKNLTFRIKLLIHI